MRNHLSLLLALLIATAPTLGQAAKIQQQGIKTLSDCTAAGATGANCLPLDSQIWDSTNAQQLSASIANGQLGGSGGGAAGVELLPNPGFETGSTVSSGYTISDATASLVTTTGTGLLYGKKTARWQPTVINQTFASPALTIAGLKGGSCSASLYYTYAGTAGDYVFKVLDGSSNVLGTVALPVSSDASTPYVLTFPCGGTASSTLQWILTNTVSTPSAIFFDNNHLGSLALQQVSQATLVGTITAICTSGTWQTSSVNPTMASLGTATCTYSTTGSALAPLTNIAGIRFASLPAGEYTLDGEGAFGSAPGSSTASAYFQFTDGTNTARDVSSLNTTSSSGNQYVPSIRQSIAYSTAQSNVTLQIFGSASGAGTPFALIPSDSARKLTIRVYRFPTGSDLATRADMSAASWSGTSTLSATTAATSTADPGTVTGAVTTVTSTNMTCSAASSLLGITCNLPRPGKYEVCYGGDLSNGATPQNTQAFLSDGSNNPLGGSQQVDSAYANAKGSIGLCTGYNATAIGNSTFKIRGQVSGSTGTFRVSTWSVKYIEQGQPLPTFPGLVSSNSSGLERIERVTLAAPSAGSCAITRQSGSWITGTPTSGGTGSCAATIAANIFSAAPICLCGADSSASGAKICQVNNSSTTTTQVLIEVFSTSGSASGVSPVNIICMGPR